MKILSDMGYYFKDQNEVLNKWDWRHDNLHRYSNFFLKCKGLFKTFNYAIYQEWELKEIGFIKTWCQFKQAEQLLVMRAHGYNSTFYFKERVKDPDSEWGYRIQKKLFDYIKLQKDLEDLVFWCDQQRAELYRSLSVDFLKLEGNDTETINKAPEKQIKEGLG